MARMIGRPMMITANMMKKAIDTSFTRGGMSRSNGLPLMEIVGKPGGVGTSGTGGTA